MMIAIVVIFSLLILFEIYCFLRAAKIRSAAKHSWTNLDVHLRFRQEAAIRSAAIISSYTPQTSVLQAKLDKIKANCHKALPVPNRAEAEKKVSNLISQLLIIANDHPEILEQSAYREQYKLIIKFESKIEAAAKKYNEEAASYSRMVSFFPNNFIAGILDFEKVYPFEFEKAIKN
ncbi:LemA family protein [Parelusimicrobium proximum]|uniref:LemA family protein n=1 Tax=Parelusimicrobium proximum TaxID=3228953 RepID=UPI003D165139